MESNRHITHRIVVSCEHRRRPLAYPALGPQTAAARQAAATAGGAAAVARAMRLVESARRGMDVGALRCDGTGSGGEGERGSMTL